MSAEEGVGKRRWSVLSFSHSMPRGGAGRGVSPAQLSDTRTLKVTQSMAKIGFHADKRQ